MSKNGQLNSPNVCIKNKMVKNCPFCDEYACSNESQFYVEVGSKIGRGSRVLLETDNWYVIPSLGSLTVGYVLLVTKQHYLSLANIGHELFTEMLDLKKNVEDILYDKLGMRCIAFEHGTVNADSKGANSVDHVHVHILPFSQPVWQDIALDIPQMHFDVVNSYQDLYSGWEEVLPNSYLLFQDLDQKIYYVSDASNMPSQLFRKCLAPYVGADHWDWRCECYSDNITQTIELFNQSREEDKRGVTD